MLDCQIKVVLTGSIGVWGKRLQPTVVFVLDKYGGYDDLVGHSLETRV